MAGVTNADLSVLDLMSRSLSHAADGLDAVGKGSPGIPTAGDVSGIMGAAIAHLTENAGNIVLGMKGASEEVAKASQDYAGKDQAAGDLGPRVLMSIDTKIEGDSASVRASADWLGKSAGRGGRSVRDRIVRGAGPGGARLAGRCWPGLSQQDGRWRPKR